MRTAVGRGRRSGERRRGTAATELALLLPLLVVIVFGAVDFGRFAHSYIAVTNAARAGAGYAAMNPSTVVSRPAWRANTRQAVIDEMQQMDGFDASLLTVNVSDPINDGGSLWRVSVDVRYPFRTLVSWPGVPNNTSLQRVVVMRGIR